MASNGSDEVASDKTSKKLLIIGAGSIGERHARAFRLLGLSVALVDERIEHVREVATRVGCSGFYVSLEQVPLEQFDGALIATPADTHVTIARACASAGLHLLVEKPFATALPGVPELVADCKQRNLTLAVAYVLRFHPVVERIRQICREGVLGRLLHLYAICHHYLPSSRPDYQRTYYASPTAGGGVVLDLSHELNYIEWVLGPLTLSHSRVGFVPELGIPGEMIANISLQSIDGVPAQIHLNSADREMRRECHVVGTKATLTANMLTGEIVLHSSPDHPDRIYLGSERDKWHLALAEDFLRALGTGTLPRCTGEEGLQTLRLCLEIMAKGS